MRSRNGSFHGRVGEADVSRVIDLREAEVRNAAPLTGEFSGPEAADLAGISYRQLDYWARRRWVVPSRVTADGVQRRVYSAADVVRLAALGHLGRSRVDVATYGRATGGLPVPNSLGFLVVWAIHDESVVLAPAKDLRHVASEPGRYVVFDPAPLLRDLHGRRIEERVARPRRRTFSPDYKLSVLAEYERLTEPGAKGALLRREGLHTSHLVAWRRGRAAGDLGRPPRPGRLDGSAPVAGQGVGRRPEGSRPAIQPA